jgi:hypothetical protein
VEFLAETECSPLAVPESRRQTQIEFRHRKFAFRFHLRLDLGSDIDSKIRWWRARTSALWR